MATTQSTESGGFTANEQRALYRARAILDRHLRVSGVALSSPEAVWDYLRVSLSGVEHEVFMVLLLDTQNRLLRAEEAFRGTLTHTAVYPREVVKMALTSNAASVIFAHNHPSGAAEPSTADEILTNTLKRALALVDVRVLDHIIIGARGPITSFVTRGLL